MTPLVLTGDCREMLPTLAPGSVQTCITTPPYWSTRDYEVPPLIWGGDPGHDHSFHLRFRAGQHTGYGDHQGPPKTKTGTCLCGAWFGPLGLEPTVGLYIDHVTECFHFLRRPLADDGTLWVSIGDSYANKSLVEAPSQLALQMRSQGWFLRSRIPWIKRGAMHERPSKDRLTGNIDYLFMFSKNPSYYYDPTTAILQRKAQRITDFFDLSWQGLLLDADGEPMALMVNQRHTKLEEDHYALFPNQLIEPLVELTTREGDAVLDMFGGVGTTGAVAAQMGRQGIVCELKPSWARLAKMGVA